MNTKFESRLHRKPGTTVQDRPPSGPQKRPAWTMPTDGDRNRKTWTLGAAVVALAILAVAIGFIVTRDGGASAAPLTLSAGSDATASCMPFDVQTLAGMSTAFAGTVTQLESGAITMDVDRWYIGGDAQTVRLTTIDDAQALLGGFPFEVGSQYLLTASNGALNYCGYSGPATPEFQNSFNTAFAG